MRRMRRWVWGVPLVAFVGLGLVPGVPHPTLGVWWIPAPPRGEVPLPQLGVQRVLIVAPHPDDEVLALGGTIARLLEHKSQVLVVFLTNGDANRAAKRLLTGNPLHRAVDYRALGYRRQKEAVNALRVLGLPKNHALFLSFPDQGLSSLTNKNWKEVYRSPFTKAQAAFYTNSYRPGAPYTGETLTDVLAEIMKAFSPTVVYLPHPEDGHPDHRASVQFTVAAVLKAGLEQSPEMRLYLVHAPSWPSPRRLNVALQLDPPPTLGQWTWRTKELNPELVKLKLAAVRAYSSQRLTNGKFLASFVRSTELYALYTAPARPLPTFVPGT